MHPLQHTWTVYVHGPSDNGTYTASYKPWWTLETCEDFGAFCHFFPPDEVLKEGTNVMKTMDVYVTTVSIFKDGIKPEWEDPHNHHGHTLTTRYLFGTTKLPFHSLWKSLLAYLVGHTRLSFDVNGMQMTFKRSHKGVMCKVDLWLPPSESPSESIRRKLKSVLHVDFDVAKRDH